MFNDPLYRFQTYLSREYDIGFHDPTILTPYLNTEEVWKEYKGQDVVIAAFGPADHLHPDLAANYDTNYLQQYNARAAGDLDSGVVVTTFWLGLAAAVDNNGTGIVGVAPDATVRGEFRVDPSAPADVYLAVLAGDPYEEDVASYFNQAARAGLGNIILMNSPDTWQSTGDYTSGTLHSEYGMNTDRHNVTVSGLTALGYEPHGLGNTHGPMTLVSVPIFTSSYLTPPVGPIPEPNEDTVWNGGFDPLASADTTTTLGLDVSGNLGQNDSDSLIGSGWQIVANAWFPETRNVNSADYTYDASTNGAVGVAGGVVALMLDANPDLGWRDVQEILAYAANPVLARPIPLEPDSTQPLASTYFDDVQNGAKNWNGGGLWHSNETGFGALDAHAAVRLAETWDGRNHTFNEQSFSVRADGLPTQEFPMGEWTNLSGVIGQDTEPQYGDGIHKSAPVVLEYTVDVNQALDIEHVALSVDLTATEFGSGLGTEPGGRFIFSIISPDGTESVVSSSTRPFYWDGPDNFETVDWDFTTRAFWGEQSNAGNGEWTIRVEYSEITDERVDVTIDDLSLDFYGKAASADDTYIFTDVGGLLPLEWRKEGTPWTIRPDAPVLNDAAGKNMINAAAITQDAVLTARAGETARADYDPNTELDTGGATSYDMYRLSSNALIDGLIAGDGNDLLRGSSRSEYLDGGRGGDTIDAGAGNDTIIGGESTLDLRDIVYGGAGNDSIDGGYGNDELRGDAGNDSIAGGYGVDTVIGGAGNDVMTGSAFSDLVFGGEGNDFVNGGFGSDRVNGGTGADRFYHVGVAGHGSDWIQDFSHAQGDKMIYGGNANINQFQVNIGQTPNAGTGVAEAFVIYKPTGQILWALVDGANEARLMINIAGTDYDLLA